MAINMGSSQRRRSAYFTYSEVFKKGISVDEKINLLKQSYEEQGVKLVASVRATLQGLESLLKIYYPDLIQFSLHQFSII